MLVMPGMMIGGGSSIVKTFSPLDYSGLTQFIDAPTSPVTYSSGNLIATVGDLSGNNNHLSDDGGVNKFAYLAAGYHEKPSYRMNGTRAVLKNDVATLYGQAGSVTVFYTLSPLPMSYAAAPLSLYSGNARITNRADNQNVSYLNNQANQPVVVNPDIASTEVYAVTINFTDNAHAQLIVNGVAYDVFDPNNAYYTNGFIRIGALNITTDAHPIEFHGNAVYNRVLSLPEAVKLHAWGIARYRRHGA